MFLECQGLVQKKNSVLCLASGRSSLCRLGALFILRHMLPLVSSKQGSLPAKCARTLPSTIIPTWKAVFWWMVPNSIHFNPVRCGGYTWLFRLPACGKRLSSLHGKRGGFLSVVPQITLPFSEEISQGTGRCIQMFPTDLEIPSCDLWLLYLLVRTLNNHFRATKATT